MTNDSPSSSDLNGLRDHEIRNRELWNAESDRYQARHGGQLAESGGLAWGTTQVPEAELRILGEVAGKDILEFGCGAAQWSIALAKAGAHPVGVDLSERQLDHARTLMAAAGVSFPLIHASAEAVPLPDASFDIVFCDHGAMTFADPYRTVPEASRLLREGGLFAFSHHIDYFGLRRLEDDCETVFQLPFGEWVRLFRANGLVVKDLVEPRPDPDATSSYRNTDELAWARRWPAEAIWRLRRI